jgi:hypothetical protein
MSALAEAKSKRKDSRYWPPVVGDMLDISAMDAMAVRNPKKAPRYTQIAPALPPLRMANCDALNCASQVAMRTIVNPKIVRKRKLRCVKVRSRSLRAFNVPKYLGLLGLAHSLHVELICYRSLLE